MNDDSEWRSADESDDRVIDNLDVGEKKEIPTDIIPSAGWVVQAG